MADQSDIETSLVSAIGQALYPLGPLAPGLMANVYRIFRGAPAATVLTADLAAGIVNVTVAPDPALHADVTRYLDEPQIISNNAPTLGITIAGTTATVVGTPAVGQVAGLLIDNFAVVHRLQQGDTADLIAATLGTYARTRTFVIVQGARVSIPNARSLTGRVVSDRSVQREVRRQQQGFRVTLWCPSPLLRDAVGAAVDQALTNSNWLPLADGTLAYLRAHGSTVFDQSQNANLYRRDLLYAVEYATTVTATLPSMIFGDLIFAPTDTGSVKSLLA